MDSLKSRLASLRRQSGTEPPACPPAGESAPEAAPPLRSRLERLGRARRPDTPPAGADDAALARRLGGQLAAEGLIALEAWLPADTACGSRRLGAGPDLAPALAAFGHGGRAVCMDTETTGLSGGTGTVVFLLGLGILGPGGLLVRQYLITGFAGEEALLDAAAGALGPGDTLVSYNGRGFDAPLLAARYRLAGREDPFARLPHLDLLAPTRAAFAKSWPDCRLATVERRLLGLRRQQDLPGSEAPAAWFSWVRRRDDSLLSRVVQHNHQDIVSLAVLLQALHEVYARPAAHGGCDIGAVARHHRRRGDHDTAFDLLRANARLLDTNARLELATHARRRGDWSLAAAVWSELARHDHPQALEHLAKYHEHVLRDHQEALRLTRRLRAVAPHAQRYQQRELRLLTKTRHGSPGLEFPDRVP